MQLQNKHEMVRKKRERQEACEQSANHKAGSQLYCAGFGD